MYKEYFSRDGLKFYLKLYSFLVRIIKELLNEWFQIIILVVFYRAREDFVCLMREAVNTSPDPQQVTNPWVLINCDGEEVKNTHFLN